MYNTPTRRLGINLDHIATLRQARREKFPSLLRAAFVCEYYGANIITIHLREDRRHIQDSDVWDLKRLINLPINLEMAPTYDMFEFAKDIAPDMVTLVPEKRHELTTEGGLNVSLENNERDKVIEKLKEIGIMTSLFINPDEKSISLSEERNIKIVELHTGKYANTPSLERYKETENIKNMSNICKNKRIKCNVGHGLNYNNINEIAKIDDIQDFHIGFSIIAEALFSGLGKAVADMKRIISNPL